MAAPPDSLYKGKRQFTIEQAIFVAECALTSALDRIESGLPPNTSFGSRQSAVGAGNDPTQLTSYDRGALECAGMMLGVLYAQLTGDGLGIYDALLCTAYNDDCPSDPGLDFVSACERLVRESWADEGKQVEARLQKLEGGACTFEQLYGSWPNTRKHAVAFVVCVFGSDDLSSDPK